MPKLISFQGWFGKDAQPSKRRVVQGFKICLLICFFIALLWIIPIADVLRVIKSANPYLLIVGISLGLPKIYLNSVMLGLLTRKQGLSISINRLFVVNLMVKFYMLFLPGALIGSGIRWAKISSSGKSTESFVAVAINRFIEIFLIIVTGILWFLVGFDQENINIHVLFIFVIIIVAAWIFLIKISKFLVMWFENKPTIKPKHSIQQKVWSYLKKIVNSLSVYSESPIKESILLIFIGILSYFVGLASFILIARSTGILISVIELGWIRSIILVAAYSPISIAGGLGIREVSLVAMLSLFGVDVEVSLAFSLLLFARNIFISLIGGVFEFREIILTRKAKNK